MTLKTLAERLRGEEAMAALLLYSVGEILAQAAHRPSPPPPGRIVRGALPNPVPRHGRGTTRKEKDDAKQR